LVLGNRHVHQLNFLALLVLETLFEAASVTLVLVTLHQLDLLLQLLLFFNHLVDTLDQIHIVLHKATIILSVLLQVFREMDTVVGEIALVSSTLRVVRVVLIKARRQAVAFVENPRFV